MSKPVEAKKRKGASEPVVSTKKVKTTTTEKPAPKSALKKPEAVKTAASSRPSRKKAEDFLEPEVEKPAKKTFTKASPAKAAKVTKTTVTESPKPAASAASKVTKAKGKGKKAVEVVEEKIALDEDSDSEVDADVDDQTAALLAGFESSEDERDPQDEDGIALDKLPALPNEKEVRKQLKEAKGDDESAPGVIYVGRIPHGFYEGQMREYFSQFGEITHLRMARDKLTGRSKHYAFIEFGSAAVADIVVKTMDKYLLFGHILQVHRLTAEQVHENLWKGEGRRFKVMPRNKIEGGLLKRGTTREGWEKRTKQEEKNRSKKALKLKEMGYEFEMPALRSVSDVPTQEAIEGEGAPVPESAEIKALLEKAEEQAEVEATPEKKVAEKAGAKRVKSKGDGKKAKKAKVAA